MFAVTGSAAVHLCSPRQLSTNWMIGSVCAVARVKMDEAFGGVALWSRSFLSDEG